MKTYIWSAVLLLGSAILSLAVPQRGPIHLTPQESAELNRLLEDASTAVNQIPEWGIRQGDLLDLVGLYSALGEHTRAHAIVETIWKKYDALSEATASGQNPPPGMYPGVGAVLQLSNIASRLGQEGDLSDALDIIKQLGYDDATAQALGMIACYQAEDGDFQGALKTVSRISVEGWRDSTLRQIVYTELQDSHISNALAATAQFPLSSPERVHQLVVIAHAQRMARNRQAAASTVAEAQRVAAELPEQTPPGPQNFTVSYLCSPGPNRSPREQALQYVAQGQWELGDYTAAMATRAQIQSASLKEQTLYNFIKADAGMDRFAEAAELIDKLPVGACRNYAHAAVAAAEVAAGDLAAGIAQASQIEPSSSLTWTNLAMKTKDPSASKALFARARAVPASVYKHSELKRAQALYGVAAMESLKPGLHQLYCADSEEAIRLARDAQTKAEQPTRPGVPVEGVGGFTSNDAAYERIITFANCGELPQAKAIALKQGGSMRQDEIGSIAIVETENGDAPGAEKWAYSLTRPSDRASALIGIVEGLLRKVRERPANSRTTVPAKKS